MIFQTPILALLLVSALASAVALWSGWFAVRVLRHWNLASGAREQLRLERATELVSTLFRFVMLAELGGLVLFVFNADHMAKLFVGAMCAVGTLSANEWGFPALYLKIAVFFAAAVWLMLDGADRLGRDYPLTRIKYGAILAIAPLVVASAAVQLTYFLNLETDVITSCCSKLFTAANEGIAADMTGMDPGLALELLAVAGLVVALTGGASLWLGRGYRAFALAGGAFFFVALAAIVSVISLYIYDHPNHHCPFCILKPEYGYVGYALYLPLFAATALSLGAGVIRPFTQIGSLSDEIPELLRRKVAQALVGFAIFGFVVIWSINTSRLILFG